MYKFRFCVIPKTAVFLFLAWFAVAPARAQNITTVVGNGVAGYNGNSTALTLQLSAPSGVALDAAGDLFIADTGNCTVWEMPSGQTNLSRFAGDPGFCTTNTSTTAMGLTLYNPAAVASCNGNVYIATHLQSVTGTSIPYTVTYTPASIFAINIASGAVTSLPMPTNTLTTTTGIPVYPDPQALACDASGNVFLQSLLGYNIQPTRTSLDEIPSSGSDKNLFNQSDTFFNGAAVVVASSIDDIYTAAQEGELLEFSGSSSENPITLSNKLVNPSAVAADSKGNLYISEDTITTTPTTPNNYIVTLTPPATAVSVIAGNGTAGFSGDGGPATSAELNNPGGIAVDSAGDVFFADTSNNRIREIVAPQAVSCPAPPTFSPPAGTYPSSQTVTITENAECPGTTIYFLTGVYSTENATTSSTLYTGPLNITGPPSGYGASSKYIGAIAVQNATSSAVATAGYTISGGTAGVLQAATIGSQSYGATYQDGSEAYPFLVPDTVVNGTSSVTLLLTNVGPASIIGPSALSATGSAPYAVSAGGSNPNNAGDVSCNFVSGLPGGSAEAGSTTTCTETVTFSPTTGGVNTGYVTFSGNALNEPTSVYFSGNAIATGGPGNPSNVVPDPASPVALTITPDLQAVAINGDGSLLVIDGTTDKQDAACAAPSQVGSGVAILADPSVNQVYAAFGDSGSSPYELGVEVITANGTSCTPNAGQDPGQFSIAPRLLAYDTYNGQNYVYSVLASGGGNLDQIEIVNLSTGAMTSTTLGYSASYLWIAVDPASHLVFIGSNGTAGSAQLYEVNPFAAGSPVSVGYNAGPEGAIFSQNGFVAPNPANTKYGELFLVGGSYTPLGGSPSQAFEVIQLDISKFPALPATTTTQAGTIPSSALLFNMSAGNSQISMGTSTFDVHNKIVYAAGTTTGSNPASLITAYNFTTQELTTAVDALPSDTTVNQLAFDAANNYLYWTATGSTSSSVNEFKLTNGTAPITLFTGTAADLTVDQTNGKLYAIDGSNILIFDSSGGTTTGPGEPAADALSLQLPTTTTVNTSITVNVILTSSGSGTPTGTMTISASENGGTPVSIGTISAATAFAAGTTGAPISVTLSASGAYTVSASYAGDSNFAAATSTNYSIVVSAAAPPSQAGLAELIPGIISSTFSNVGTSSSLPVAPVFDASGNLYILDSGFNSVTEYPAGGAGPIVLVPQSGPQPLTLDTPSEMILESNGSSLLITDYENNRLVRVTFGSPATVIALSLTGVPSGPGSCSNNYPGTSLCLPTGIAEDATGNIYVSDTGYGRVLKFTPSGAFISTVLAAGSSALVEPLGLAMDASGNLYVANITGAKTGNLLKVAPQNAVTTISGGGITQPFGLATDAAGDVYFSDSAALNVGVVTPSSGTILVAGNGAATDSGDGGPATLAGIQEPLGITLDSSGNVYVMDSNESSLSGGLLREVKISQSAIAFGNESIGSPTSTQQVRVLNAGGSGLNFSGATVSGANASDFALTSGCPTSASLASGQDCILSVVFTPSITGAESATITVTDSSGGSAGATQAIAISGSGTTQPVAATPTFSVSAGTYPTTQTVTLADTTTGATIYYTTDGSTPTASSTTYTTAIAVGVSQTIKAIAVATGYSNSAVASASYIITAPGTFTFTATAVNPSNSIVGTTVGNEGNPIAFNATVTVSLKSQNGYNTPVILSVTLAAVPPESGVSPPSVACVDSNGVPLTPANGSTSSCSNPITPSSGGTTAYIAFYYPGNGSTNIVTASVRRNARRTQVASAGLVASLSALLLCTFMKKRRRFAQMVVSVAIFCMIVSLGSLLSACGNPPPVHIQSTIKATPQNGGGPQTIDVWNTYVAQ